MSEAPLLPFVDAESLPFWEGCRAGELRVQRCRDTGRLLFPPRARSPHGARRAPEWVTVSGRGAIWSFAVPHPPLLPQFAAHAPYNVVVVSLAEEERVRLVGNLLPHEGAALGSFDPGAIEIGAPVRVCFERVSDEITLPRWIPA